MWHSIKINVVFVPAAYFHPNDCNGNDGVNDAAYRERSLPSAKCLGC